jgi:hypothetical protein
VPVVILLAVALVAALLLIVLVPLGMVRRYRAGTARRSARGWIAALNVGGFSFSVVLFLVGATVTNLWAPNALMYSLAGLMGGSALGLLALTLTRWEGAEESLHYTPNPIPVLLIIVVVAARLVYGFWRLWESWHLGPDGRAWLLNSGVPGSLAAGAIVLSYSLTYWIGVSRRIRQQRDVNVHR